MRTRGYIIVVAASVALGGCGGSGTEGSTGPTPTASEPGSSTESPSATQTRPRPRPPELTVTPPDNGTARSPGERPRPGTAVEAAVLDLADRLGVPPEQVAVVSVEEVTWNDSSLGCPSPGKMYAQMLSPGQRIELEHGGRHYDYRAARGHTPFLCERQFPRPTQA
jgi:hypothetical protein